MNNFEIIKHNDVTFDEYKMWFEKYKENGDERELKTQNEIVKKFLDAMFPELDVEDCANKGPDSPKHDYCQYCGTYIDNKTGKEKPSTPDLVIAPKWHWENKKNIVDYRAVVEVKSPYLQAIYHKNYENYGSDLRDKLSCHLSAKNNDKVILTDSLKWEFYEKNEESDNLIPIKTFRLYDLLNNRGKWEWKKGKKVIVEDDVVKEIFGGKIEYEYVKEFEELKNFLKDFLNKVD